jgi:hypothetical protein
LKSGVQTSTGGTRFSATLDLSWLTFQGLLANNFMVNLIKIDK